MLGAFQIYRQLKEYGEGESSYTEIEQYVWVDEAPEDGGDEEQNGSQSGEGEPGLRWPAVDFDALSEINPDIVAWIYIEDTEINYPVVQGTDNQYYLNGMVRDVSFWTAETHRICQTGTALSMGTT